MCRGKEEGRTRPIQVDGVTVSEGAILGGRRGWWGRK